MSKISEITAQIQTLILGGSYPAHKKFLSVRQLATQYQISLNSANKVLQSLEDLGLLYAQPKSGFFVGTSLRQRQIHQQKTPNHVAFETSALFSINDHIKDRASSIRKWAETVNHLGKIHFDLATSSPDFYPTTKLQTIHNRLTRHHPDLLTEYAIGSGSIELREQISIQYAKANCWLHPNDIAITQGATQALMLALQACTHPGDWVLIESPTYFGFLQLLDILKLNAVEIPIDVQQGLQPKDVHDAIAQAHTRGHRISACLLQPNHHNPTGTCISPAIRAELLHVFQYHNIAVIEDDTFGELRHHAAKQRFPPLKSADVDGNVILCSSLTKLVAPGMRIGMIVGGRRHEAIKTLQHATTISCSNLPQRVISEFMRTSYNLYLKKLRTTCAKNIQIATDIITEFFPVSTQINLPAANMMGGYLIWVSLPNELNADELLNLSLKRAGIAFAPGILFSNLGTHRNALRINCARMNQADEQNGLKNLGSIISSL